MKFDDWLNEARQIWGTDKPTIQEMTLILGVIYGDICRQARAANEDKPVDNHELKKEFGNILLSLIRWCDDLGYSPEECLGLAKAAQKHYHTNN